MRRWAGETCDLNFRLDELLTSEDIASAMLPESTPVTSPGVPGSATLRRWSGETCQLKFFPDDQSTCEGMHSEPLLVSTPVRSPGVAGTETMRRWSGETCQLKFFPDEPCAEPASLPFSSVPLRRRPACHPIGAVSRLSESSDDFGDSAVGSSGSFSELSSLVLPEAPERVGGPFFNPAPDSDPMKIELCGAGLPRHACSGTSPRSVEPLSLGLAGVLRQARSPGCSAGV